MIKVKYFLLLVFGFIFTIVYSKDDPVRIACIGNSITYGSKLDNPQKDSYPAVLEQMLGKDYDVRNFGVSARTMLNKGDYPYMHEKAYFEALKFNPDIVTIKLGTNDSKPYNWIHKSEFVHDLGEMLNSFSSLPSKPKIIVCLPVPSIPHGKNINDETIKNEIIPLIKKVALNHKVEILDFYTEMMPYYPALFPDGVHPNSEGAAIMAGILYKKITGKQISVVENTEKFPGVKSKWNGFDKFDFVCAGRSASVVVPPKNAAGNPWIWRPAFFGVSPELDLALLKEGFHIAYYDLTNLYGGKRAMAYGDLFYERMVKGFHLSPKVTLEGLSRGGLCALKWAAHNPKSVACIYVDAPVCDLTSWPGRSRTDLWNDMLDELQVNDKDVTSDFSGNAFNAIDALVKNNIPVISVCGDSDRIVPYEDNMKKFKDEYFSKGGIIEIILKPGCDHHPHGLDNPEPVVDFIKRYQKGESAYRYINSRASLTNSFKKFVTEGKGNVAFLGGSITEMKGWRNMIQDDLKQRFPDTEFSFIDAGIGSTGSTPHAFRFKTDVLDHGIPDLLFVEAAVNDHTNGFSPLKQVRGMEGIIRHALTVNPNMDIVMLHFVYEPFVEMYKQGRRPDVVLNHERVANYYNVSSIDFVQEICDRMNDGQFTWKQFGGTHPLKFGHKFYANSINALFDLEQKKFVSDEEKSHLLPQDPLEEYCYQNGDFYGINNAYSLKGFKLVEKWNPNDNVKTRKGFVNVPMLVSQKSGASLKLKFKGSAIGFFGVSGPAAGKIKYKIDNGNWKVIDTVTKWSSKLYLPRVFMFDDELSDSDHTITIVVDKNGKGGCWIRNFVVNR